MIPRDGFQPIAKAGQLVLGDPQSDIAICTCWTPIKQVASKLAPWKYAVIGQLYSPSRGLTYLLANLLANPQIRHLIVTGSNPKGTWAGEALIQFFAKGFMSYNERFWQVAMPRTDQLALISKDIPREALGTLLRSVQVIGCDVRDVPHLVEHLHGEDELAVEVGERTRSGCEPWGEPIVVELKGVEVDTYPAEESGFVVRARTVAEAWPHILHDIMRFGHTSGTHYDAQQKELLDLVTVIEAEPLDSEIPNWFPIDAAYMETYNETVSGFAFQEPGSTKYSYAHRLRSHFGIDQVEEIVRKLTEEPDSRSAVFNLWDSTTGERQGGSPCLNHGWFRLREDRLYCTVVIRSNDMYSAWPANAYALRRLQFVVASHLVDAGVSTGTLGDLVIISESAHVYDDCWEHALEVIRDHYPPKVTDSDGRVWDPRGNLRIELTRDVPGLLVTLLDPYSDYELASWASHDAKGMIALLSEAKVISLASHAMYVGTELAKAELALKADLRYEQDKPLSLAVR